MRGPCYFFFFEDGARGTFPPSRLASDSPMAIACLRLFTVLPDPPDLSCPRFISCIALSTLSEAFFPYFRPPLVLDLDVRLELRRFVERVVGMVSFHASW